jgi:phenylacetate-CoA ligase
MNVRMTTTKTRFRPWTAAAGFALDLYLGLASVRYSWFKAILAKASPRFLEGAGTLLAARAARRARHRVPAYRSLVARSSGSIPETDKKTYIDGIAPQERCVNGRIPSRGTVIDESSGSTGTPYHWIRSPRERRESQRFISFFAQHDFGSDPVVTINGFSMGAWATGLNMGQALTKNGIVKNTGPDIDKILETLRYFGTGYRYLILGYPPFLKRLADEAGPRGFRLGDYRLAALVGGEGMSEGLRNYLQQWFSPVYSGYGATDLEIGIAGETPMTVALRRAAAANPELRRSLFGSDPRMPMIFQYNPLMHHVEVNENGELVFTITRKSLLSPRIRYNIHDQGGVMRYDELAEALAPWGFHPDDWVSPGTALRLPILWIHGRKDYTVSVMGANIYPEDVEQAVYSRDDLASVTRSYCLSLTDETNGGARPLFSFEVTAPITPELKQTYRDAVIGTLVKLNADFREAWREYPGTLEPEIALWGCGEGPFAADGTKIKQVRLVK